MKKRFIKLAAYNLMHRYGENAIYKFKKYTNFDRDTGHIQPFYMTANVRVLVFPKSLTRSFSYDIAYLASNKNFTYGGEFDENTRLCLVWRKDLHLPTTLEDEIIINDVVYKIKNQPEDFDDSYLLILTLTRYINEEEIT